DGAAANGGYLILPPGIYIARNLSIRTPLCLQGMPGLTQVTFSGGDHLLKAAAARNITLSGIIFDGAGKALTGGANALVAFSDCDGLTIEQCEFRNSSANALALSRCSGRLVHNTLAHAADAAIFATDSNGLEIAHNHVHDMADNGILIWQSEPREDGSVVSNNRIERIANKSGGSGQWGNGINIFRAGNVVAANNHISDCAFTAIRNHSGSNVQMIANNCSRSGEAALYSEFAFEGAVISNNVVDGAATGISITNFNDGGRLAVCSNNLVRHLTPMPGSDKKGVGIAVEADTVVTGNVIEDAADAGMVLGWGRYARNISATGNIIRRAAVGIAASATEGAESCLIANNIIAGAHQAAILGMDHARPVTSDLARQTAQAPANLAISGNLVS
ncbi:MAG: TIGR03808 family TAT-translocated repetitive protein, partial [Rhizobiales bacterium]|nr:TIGR03808 family TAT-translocated repetitive protein [Hyphomicrobiales bacterium]